MMQTIDRQRLLKDPNHHTGESSGRSTMISGILKRKHEEGPSSHLSTAASDDEVSCSDSGNSSDSLNPPVPSGLLHSSLQPKSKRFRGRNVHFENVTVYYFGRRQGFTSVPTQGGSTLGMSPRHSCVRSFTLREFALEQKRSHRNMLRHHLKEEKLNAIRLKLTKNGTESSAEADTLSLDDISVDELEVDNTEVDEYFFLQPLTTRRRRALLRASGVRRIAVEEKHELRTLRVSREECGCRCRGACEPETCACSLAGIKCQVNGSVVDRMSFPCGCTKDGCSNSAGRLEFNPVRVRTHFLHTIMKLELEKSREEPLLHLQHPPPPPPPPLSEHQQLVTNGNGFHSDPSSLVQTQQQPNLQFPLMMHLQSDAADPCLEEEEERDEEEEDDDDDDDDEEEEDEAYEEDEDGSSVCSGLSDCSTHSLDTNDPEDAEDSEEEEDDEGEEEDEDEEWDCPLQSTNAPPYPVPLPSILSYSNSTLASPSFHYRENQGQSLPTVDTALNSDISSTQHQPPPCCLPPQLLLNSQSLPPSAQMREEEAAPSGGHSALLPNNPDWCDSQTDNVAKKQTADVEGETLKEINQNTT